LVAFSENTPLSVKNVTVLSPILSLQHFYSRISSRLQLQPLDMVTFSIGGHPGVAILCPFLYCHADPAAGRDEFGITNLERRFN